MWNNGVLCGCLRPFFLLVLALAVWLSAADSRAEWPADGLPVCVVGSAASDLQIVSDDSRGLYLVWSDARSGTRRIYAQHVDAGGNIIWDENGIPVSGGEAEQNLNHICSDGAGGLWITWGEASGTYIEHLDAGGYPVFANGDYMNWEGGTNYGSVCAPDDQGGIIVAWLKDDGGWDATVWAARIDSVGEWDSSHVQVGSNACPYMTTKLSVAANADPGDGILLAWASDTDGYVQWVDASTTPRWNGNEGLYIGPMSGWIDIVDRQRTGGGAYVVYTSPSVTQYLNIEVVSVTANGVLQDLITVATIDWDWYSFSGVKVIDNGEQGVLCTWGVHFEPGGYLTGIYAKNYDYDYSLIWGPVTLPGTANKHINGWDASLKADTGDLYVSWQVDVAGTGRHQYSIVDRATGAATGEQLVPGAYSATAPRLVNSGLLCPFVDVHPLAAWIDNRNPSDGIYANSLSAEWTAVAGDAPPVALRLHANAPNPFNPNTTVRYDLPAPARVDLTIYDLAGRMVRVLRSEAVEREGRHAVVWDGRDDAGRAVASGVYIYRLQAGEQSAARRMVLVR